MSNTHLDAWLHRYRIRKDGGCRDSLFRRRLCALATVSLLPALTLSAQTSAEPLPSPHADRLWLTAGGGIGRTGGEATALHGSLAGGVGLTYQPGLLILTLRSGAIVNFFQGDAIGDAALLIGVATQGQRSHASLAVGPALAGGDLKTFQSGRTSFSSQLGLAIHAQVLALPLSSVGAGIIGFANLNRRQSFGGLLLSLAFGRLR